MYDPVIAIQDRVAIAPHTDLWMRGVRFARVIDTRTTVRGGRIEHEYQIVHVAIGRTWVPASYILGAVR